MSLKEAYRTGYLSANYFRDKAAVKKYAELVNRGSKPVHAKRKVCDMHGFTERYFRKILTRWSAH